jgi:hypothetical protein
MIDLPFIEQLLSARPFVPFNIVLDHGRKYYVRTAEHADVPPISMSHHLSDGFWLVVYDSRSVPHYLACEHIANIEMNAPDPISERRAAHLERLKGLGIASPEDT